MDFNESLVLDFNITKVNSILSHFTNQFTSTELDVKRETNILVVFGFFRIILLVANATNITTMDGVHPNVSWTSIVDNSESIFWGTNGQITSVLDILEIVKLDCMSFSLCFTTRGFRGLSINVILFGWVILLIIRVVLSSGKKFDGSSSISWTLSYFLEWDCM